MWHVIVESSALVFAAGGAWYMLQDIRKQMREVKKSIERQWERIDEISEEHERRFRRTIMILTMLAVSDDKKQIMDAIRGLAEANGKN